MNLRARGVNLSLLRGKSIVRGLQAEVLEPRVLLSADILGGSYDGGDSSFSSTFSSTSDDELQEKLLHDISPLLNRTVLADSINTDTPQPLNLDLIGRFLFEDRFQDTADEDFRGLEALLADADEQRLELIFVDASTADYQTLIDDIYANADEGISFQIFVLDGDSDGIQQISDILATFSDVDGVHIISHGTEGNVKLGNVWLNSANLSDYAEQIGSWQISFDAEADLLIYGCNLAFDESGNLLINALARLTGTDVAASDDLTGAASLGADWDLEVRTGPIETSVPFSNAAQENWQHVLAPPVINSTTTPSVAENLTAVLTVTATDADLDTVTFSLTGGDDQAKFSINATTGDLTFNAAPDFENPTDVGTDNVYEVEVTADDGFGGTDVELISVTVTDVDFAITTSGAATSNDGAVYTLNLSVADPVDPITSWTINWGDGAIETIAGNPSSATHTYDGEGFTYNILASVTDDQGATFLQNGLLASSATRDSVILFENTTGDFLDEFGSIGTLDYSAEVLIGPDGLGYVAGYTSDTVHQFDPETGTELAEIVSAGEAGLQSASGLAFGADGNLYFSDFDNNKILKYDVVTDTVTVFIDVVSDFGRADGVNDLVFDSDNNLYVSSYYTNEVFKYDGTTGALIGGGPLVAAGELNIPQQMTIGPDGHLYVTSQGSDEVFRYNTTTGALVPGPSDDAFVIAGSGTLDWPSGIAFGPDGNLYVTDRIVNKILRFDGTTGVFIDVYSDSVIDDPLNIAFVPGHQVTVAGNTAVDLDTGTGGVDYAFSFYPADPATTIVDATVSITDVDDTTLVNVTLETAGIVDGASEELTIGSLTFALNAVDFADPATINGQAHTVTWVNATGVATITLDAGEMDLDKAKTVLLATQYQNTSGTPTDGDRTIIVKVNDGDGDSLKATTVIHVDVINDKPTLTTIGNNPGVEDDAHDEISLFSGTSISTVESGQTITGFTITIFNVSPADGTDEHLTIDGTDITINTSSSGGTTANNSFGYTVTRSGGNYTIVFTGGSVTPSALETEIDNATYRNDAISQGSARVVTITQIVDSGGTANGGDDTNDLTGQTSTITEAASGTIPVIADAGGTLGYNQGDGARVIDASLTITDGDSANIESATILISGFVSSEDVLAFVDGGGITGSFNPTTGVLTLSGTATLTAYASALETVTYENTNTVDPNTDNRTITWLVNDGDTNSSGENSTIDINPVNDAPTLNLDSNDSSGAGGNDYTFIYTEGAVATAIADTDTDLADVDSSTFANVSLALSGLLDGDAEVLVLDGDSFALATNNAGQNTSGGNYNVVITTGAGTADITITKQGGGTFTEVETETLIKAIQYQHTDADNPTDGDRSIDVTVNDGAADSAVANTTINVNPANDAPTATNLTSTSNYNEADPTVALTTIVVSDIDTDPTQMITATLTLANTATGVLTTGGGGTYNGGTGIWTITDTVANVNAALAAVSFTPVVTNTLDTIITTHIQDQDAATPGDGVITLNVNPASNNAPTATNLTSTSNYNEGDATVALTAVVVTDIDAAQTITATLTLSNTATGVLTTSGTATYNGVSGIWTVTGTITAVNAALAAVSFTPAANNDQVATITTLIRDQDAVGPVAGLITLDVTPANDAPTATNLTSTSSYTEGDASVALTDIVVSEVDTDPAQTITATLTLSNTAAGVLTTGGGGTYDGGTGIWTITDTVTNVNAALAAVSFTPVANNDQDATITTLIRDQNAVGPTAGLITLDVTPTNDAPTTASRTIGLSEDTSYTFTAADFNFADIDAGDTLASVQITTLENVGSLRLNGAPVALNQVISKANIDAGLLTFTPVDNANGVAYDSLDFTVNDGLADSTTSATITFNVTAVNDDPTGNITLTGLIQEDETITADTSAISDNDGLGAFNFQWQRDGVDIAGANSGSYVAQDEDIGTTLSVVLTYTDGDGTAETITSDPTAPVANTNDLPVGEVLIIGDPIEEQTLSADASGLSDDDELGTFGYQWLRNGVAIPGAINATYTLVQEDVDQTLSVIVSFTDGQGTDEAVTSDPTAIITDSNLPPTSSGLADLTVTEDSPDSVITISHAFDDPNADELIYSLGAVSDPSIFSSVSVSADGTLILAYAPDESGVSNISVTATDPDGEFTSTSFKVTVTPVNDLASGNPDSAVVNEDGRLSVPANQGVLINDVPEEGGAALRVVQITNGSVTVPAGGTITGDNGGEFTINADGSFTFDPGQSFQSLPAGQRVETQVIYVAEDAAGSSISVPLRVVIVGSNDPVVAADDTNSTLATEDKSVTAADGLLSNDTDVDLGDSLEIVSISNGTETVPSGDSITGTEGGTFLINPDGSYTFEPGSDFLEVPPGVQITTSVTYTVTDNHGATTSVTLTVQVAGVASSLPPAAPDPVSPAPSTPASTTDPVETTPVANVATETETDSETTESILEEESEPEQEEETEEEDSNQGSAEDQAGALASLFDESSSDTGIRGIGGFQSGADQLSSSLVQITNLDIDPASGLVAANLLGFDARSSLSLIGTTDSLVLIGSPDYKRSLDISKAESEEAQELNEDVQGGTLTITAGISIGYVIWLIRSGVIMSSVLTALPAWRLVDPLPILSSFDSLDDDDDDEDDESIEQIVQSSSDTEETKAETEETKVETEEAKVEAEETVDTEETKGETDDVMADDAEQSTGSMDHPREDLDTPSDETTNEKDRD